MTIHKPLATSLNWSQHLKILESPNKHNVMTSFGIRLIVQFFDGHFIEKLEI